MTCVHHSWVVDISVAACWLAGRLWLNHTVESMPCLSCYSKYCVLTFIVLVVLDLLLQAQGALINARLVQLDKEVAEAAADLKNAENLWICCMDPAKEASLKEVYDNRVAKERQLLEERRDLERQLTGALCPCVDGSVLTFWQ